jgi:hypothetical protein
VYIAGGSTEQALACSRTTCSSGRFPGFFCGIPWSATSVAFRRPLQRRSQPVTLAICAWSSPRVPQRKRPPTARCGASSWRSVAATSKCASSQAQSQGLAPSIRSGREPRPRRPGRCCRCEQGWHAPVVGELEGQATSSTLAFLQIPPAGATGGMRSGVAHTQEARGPFRRTRPHKACQIDGRLRCGWRRSDGSQLTGLAVRVPAILQPYTLDACLGVLC